MKIDWKCQNQDTGNDDFIANKGYYILHVERLDTNCWYWSINYGDDELDHSAYHDCYLKSRIDAQKACVKAFQEILDGDDDDY